MPKEETIELRHVRNTIGETDALPSLNARATLTSRIRALLTKAFGVPQLIHLYGSIGLNKTLTFNTNENKVRTLFSDGTYLYAGLATTPGKIVKIDLETFTETSTLTLDPGENNIYSLISDGTNLYAGLYGADVGIDYPQIGKIVKINLASFTKVSTLTLDATDFSIYSLFSDGTYIYAGLDTSPAKVIKVDISTFTKTASINLTANSSRTLFSDGIYLYVGMDTTPASLIQIDLSTFLETTSLTLAAGKNSIYTLFSDGTYLYAGLATTPGKIVKIDLATFTEISTLTLSTNSSYTLFSDGTYLYVGSNTTPAKIIIVDLSLFIEIGVSTLAAGENSIYTLFSDGTYLYAGLLTSPGKVIRKYIIPSNDQHQRKIDTTKECTYSVISASTSAGAADGSTVIDTERTEGLDYWKNMTLLILGGSYKGQSRKITGFNAVTNTFIAAPIFGGQILSGVRYAILPSTESSSSALVVTDILADSIPFNGADIPIIKGDTQTIEDSTLKADPTAGSLSRFVASGGTALGTQLPASKSLYDVIALDRLDNATYGLSAIETLVDDLETAVGTIEGATTLHNKLTAARAALLDQITALRLAELDAANLPADIDIIKADTQTIEDSTLKADPTAGSLSRFVASGGTALGTQLPNSKSLYDCLSGGVTVVDRVAGKKQVFVKAITVAANAGATTIGTITTQPCIIESIIIHANTGQTANLTSCAVTGGASNIITFINAAIAIQANLDAIDKQVTWTGSVRLGATKTIVITPVGIDATALDLTIIITYYSSAVSGGYIV